FRGGVFCLLDSGGDGCVDEVECLALGVGGGGHLGDDGSVGSAVLQLVAGQGGQVDQEFLVGVDGLAGVAGLPGGFLLGLRGAFGRRDRVGAPRWVLVGVGQRGQGLA